MEILEGRVAGSPERLHEDAAGGGPPGQARRPIVAAVVAVPREDARLVAQRPAAPVRHDAGIAPGRQGRGARPVHEIEVRRAGVLVETEGQRELSRLDIDAFERAVIDVHVAPPARPDQLALDLEVRGAADCAGHAHAAARNIKA